MGFAIANGSQLGWVDDDGVLDIEKVGAWEVDWLESWLLRERRLLTRNRRKREIYYKSEIRHLFFQRMLKFFKYCKNI